MFADGSLHTLDERGNVALLKPTPQGFETRGKFKLPADRVRGDAWAHPVVFNGRLYLRYHDDLWCYDVAAKKTNTTGNNPTRTSPATQLNRVNGLLLDLVPIT